MAMYNKELYLIFQLLPYYVASKTIYSKLTSTSCARGPAQLNRYIILQLKYFNTDHEAVPVYPIMTKLRHMKILGRTPLYNDYYIHF